MRCCDPEQLIAKKRRNKLAAADKTICYLTRGTFKEDQHDTGFTDTRWVELEELYDNCGKQNLNRALKASLSLCLSAASGSAEREAPGLSASGGPSGRCSERSENAFPALPF